MYRDGSRTIQILNVGTADKIVSTTESTDVYKADIAVADKVENVQQPQDRPGVIPRKRPEVMSGKTYRIKTGYGSLYVTINDDERGLPFEVFATIGKSGGFFQEQSEAICRLISLSLRSDIRVEEVIKKLKGIRGPMPVFTEKGTIITLPDAIGTILEAHSKGAKVIDELVDRPEIQ